MISRAQTGAVTLTWLAALLALVIGSTACTRGDPARSAAAQERPSGPSSAGAEAAGPASTAVAARRVAPVELDRDQLSRALGHLAAQRAWDGVFPRRSDRLNNRDLGLNYPTLLGELYVERDHRPVFVTVEGALEPRAEPVIRELQGVHQHALDPEAHHVARIAQAVDQLDVPAPPEWPLTEADVRRLAELVSLYGESGQELVDSAALLASGLEGESPTPAVADAVAEYQASLREVAPRLADLELLIADGFITYARNMKHFNVSRMSLEELQERGGRAEVVLGRMAESFRTVAESGADETARHLESLVPHYPQYAPLMAELARYREIVANGGWEYVRPRDMNRGSSNSRVRQLKVRLAAEGYYDGPIDNVYDDGLIEAVTHYQQTHQMEVTGFPHGLFWASLNVPAERRLAQIELTLQRWRESRLRDEDYYVFVNVPDFHAEVWRDGERISRFKVVVGNNEQVCNEETGLLEYANATPLISAEIEYLVFNPYWNVPLRIRRDELDLELMENPTWLQDNGFEVVVVEGQGPRIRQLPGSDNALGQVKFIFPNIHNIYMHDTPLRRYFDFPIRGYSHGCVRVHHPMEFAELLLRNDGNWDPERIQRILESGVETTVHLETHVPIHIEYYVVRVDDDGFANFLSDVYRYDRERLDGPPDPETIACAAPPPVEGEPVEEEPVVVWNEDGTAVIPDGTVIHPDGTIDLSEERLVALEAQGLLPAESEEGGDGEASDGESSEGTRVLQREPTRDLGP